MSIRQHRRRLTGAFLAVSLIGGSLLLTACRGSEVVVAGAGDEELAGSAPVAGEPVADQLVARARTLAKERKREALLESADLFRQATELSPEKALAWSGLADTQALIGLYSYRPASESLALALPAAERALELIDQGDAGTRASTLASLGLSRFLWSRDYASAEDAFAEALAVGDTEAGATTGFDLPQTLHWFAMLLHAQGRHAEAIVHLTRAAELAPGSPLLQTKLATVLIGAGYLDQAQAQLDMHRDSFPNFAMLHRELGNIALAQSRYDEAISHFDRAIELNANDHRSRALRGQTLALSGRAEEARSVLQELESNDGGGPVSELSVALVQAGLGDIEAALASLERARDRHEGGLVYIASRPAFGLLAETEGFARLVRELGLR